MTKGFVFYREIQGAVLPPFLPGRRFVYRHLLIDRRYLSCNSPPAAGLWPRLRARVAQAARATVHRLTRLLPSNRPRRIPIRVL